MHQTKPVTHRMDRSLDGPPDRRKFADTPTHDATGPQRNPARRATAASGHVPQRDECAAHATARDGLASTPAPLELARALIDLGAALRRTGQRQTAREPLARALELAHRHGAALLAGAARSELNATGRRPRRAMRAGRDALTPSERRVAQLAAAGLSNADIAARLYITTKTVEHHLAAVYRKLSIRSRRQLPPALNPPAPPEDGASAPSPSLPSRFRPMQ